MEGEREQAPARSKSAQQLSQAPRASDSSLDTVLRIATAAQQTVTAVNAADSEEEKIMTITKIVMTIMNLNVH
jgi:hypothetical protein